MAVPVIDISKIGLLVPNDEDVKVNDYKSVGAELYKALSTVGFAYLKNSGITDQKIAEVQKKFKDFFDLDVETKKKYYFGTEMTGYFGIGVENVEYGMKDHKEAFNVNGIFLTDETKRVPEEVVGGFNDNGKEFSEICKKLTLRMFLTLSYGMKLKDVYFLANRHERMNAQGNHTTLRSTLYPPITDALEKELKVRLGAHSDFGTFTLLFQDDVGGLQVESKPGEFTDAKPIPDTIVMNIGDTMNLWTEGRLKSTVHRVAIPPNRSTRLRWRNSLAYFLHADDEVPIETMEYLPDADPPHPEQRLFDPKSGPKTALDWAMYKFYTAHKIEHDISIKQ